jgi:hypothetical protein
LAMSRCGAEQEMFVQELRGHVRQLANCPHGSEVLQCCLEVMRPSLVSFIAAELVGVASTTACSDNGWGVLCRILEFLPRTQTTALVAELLNDAPKLLRHEHAKLVMRHVYTYGTSAGKSAQH